MKLSPYDLFTKFLLTRPSRDVTTIGAYAGFSATISTHTPLAGRDAVDTLLGALIGVFLLTRPSRDVTCVKLLQITALLFLLTRPSRDVT